MWTPYSDPLTWTARFKDECHDATRPPTVVIMINNKLKIQHFLGLLCFQIIIIIDSYLISRCKPNFLQKFIVREIQSQAFS